MAAPKPGPGWRFCPWPSREQGFHGRVSGSAASIVPHRNGESAMLETAALQPAAAYKTSWES